MRVDLWLPGESGATEIEAKSQGRSSAGSWSGAGMKGRLIRLGSGSEVLVRDPGAELLAKADARWRKEKAARPIKIATFEVG